MRNSRISAAWLSDEMAYALAAMWPPLDAADVMRAADELTSHRAPSRGVHLLEDEEFEPAMVEALRALQDLRA